MLGEKMIAVAGFSWRENDSRGRIFIVVVLATFCICGLYEMDDVMDAFTDAARSVMQFMERLRAQGGYRW
jgi:hypothetical protein